MSHSTEPTMTASAQDNATIRSPMRDFWQAFIQNPLALVSGGFILLLVLVAAATHWMGTDDLGRDVMSRIIYGSRISLYIALFSVTLGMVVGIVLGLLAGFYGRWIDMLIMRSAGAPDRILLIRHILPATLPNVIVYFTMRIGTSILTVASLSFIGLGPEPDVPEWGNILAISRSMMMAGQWHVSVFPGLAIFFTVLSFNLLGDALCNTLDPKLKNA